ncbi:unnamed protein product [Natator depressus]
MILSLCLLLTTLSPSSQEICSAPGALRAPTLYLSQTSARTGDSVWLQCSMISQLLATRVVFCKDGEEVTTQKASEEKVIYSWDLVVSMRSSGNYSCGYEIKDSDNRVNGSQLSSAKHLSVTALSPSSQEICSASGAFPAPTLYLSQTSARPGDSVRLQCSVISQAPATHVVFCKDGEEVSSQMGSEENVIYSWDHAVSRGSSGNYSCAYEIMESDNQVTRSQLSPAQLLSITGSTSSSGGGEEPTRTALSPSSQEICSAPGALPAPTLYLSQTSARPGDSVRLQCSVISQAPATHVVFCKDGEEVSSQTGSKENVTYSWNHVVSRVSSGNYSCAYEIVESDNQVTRSQLSPAQHLSISGSTSRSRGAEEPIHTVPSPSSQEICSAPGARRAPTLYLSPTSAQPGDSVRLTCSVFSRTPATRVVFCKDGEEISLQTGSEEKVMYSWDHTVSRGSSGNYSCGYKTKDRDNRVSRSQLSPAKKFSISGGVSSSGGGEEPTRTGPVMSPAVWAARCVLVLLLLVSAPIITFVLEKRGSKPTGLHGGSSCILGGKGLGVGKPH